MLQLLPLISLSAKLLLVLSIAWQSTTAQECVDGEVRDQLQQYWSVEDDYGGDVHYCLSGTWATVCKVGSSWTTDDATVACKQLGYNDTGARAGFYGSCGGTDSFVSINCDGGEESLRSCNVSQITASGGTARVACRPGCSTNGEVRLVDGSSHREGRVEVCMNRRWRTVCNNNQEGIAGAVCSQLGFSRIYAVRSTTDSVRVGPVYQCTVDDSAIECTITNSSQCDHSNDLTVSCLTHKNAADYLLSQLNKTNNIVTECTQELNKTNNIVSECTQELNKTNNIVMEYNEQLNKTNSSLQECTEQSQQQHTVVSHDTITALAVVIALLVIVVITLMSGLICTSVYCYKRTTYKQSKEHSSKEENTGRREAPSQVYEPIPGQLAPTEFNESSNEAYGVI